MLKSLSRIGIEEFDSDPRNPGGVCILRDEQLHEAISGLSDWPAAWNTGPSSKPFSDQVLSLGEHLLDQYGWEVVPHFVLATKMGVKHSPLHTDWEGLTFADPRTFTLWAPQSHFGEPHLMLLHPEFWPPPHSEFVCDQTGLYARTMLRDEAYRRYSSRDRLRVLDIRLQKGEVLAFNGTIPHCTHPDTPLDRLAVNLRCPSNRGTKEDPKVYLNATAPNGQAILRNIKSTSINRILSEVDAQDTPKGYFELFAVLRQGKQNMRLRRFMRRIARMARLSS